MIRAPLFRFVLNISYYNSLILGLLPAPLERGNLEVQVTRVYLTYSAFAHIICVLISTYAGYYYISYNFMTNDPIMQWTYTVTYLTKNLFLVMLVKELWCKRERIKSAYMDYCVLEARLQAFTAATKGPDGEHADESSSELHLENLQRHLAKLIILKFFLAYVLIIMNAYNFLSQHPGTDASYIPITYISFALNTYMVTVSGNFFYIFSQLYKYFSQINSQLKVHFMQLQCQMSPVPVDEVVAGRINTLAMLHRAGYRLTQRIFTIGEFTLATLLLRLFTANMRTVYGACLLLSQNQTKNLWSQANELFFTAVFFGDTAMVMGMLDAVLAQCNHTGQLLREYVELVAVSDGPNLKRALDTFATHLSCHKLRYMICGLFEFNKEASLQFFLLVLVKTSVLVQFDMQNKLRVKVSNKIE